MAWIRARRAYLIGTGAIVVALVSIGVVLHTDRSSMHPRAYFDGQRPFVHQPLVPLYGRASGPQPLFGGPTGPRRFYSHGHVAPVPRFAPPGLRPGVDPLRQGPDAPIDQGVLHGELTVKGPRGSYETVDVQRGKVTKLSATSITVKSADGYTATYTLAHKASSLKVGDDVQLRATVAGKKATVTRLATTNSHKSTPMSRPAR